LRGRRVHFLHIGKTGGTAIRYALSPHLTSIRGIEIILHPHETTLADIPVGEKAIFALRDPIDRFVSGFNSRRRRGPPHNVEWTAAEEAAFGSFVTPNDLAVALSAPNAGKRAAAISAIRGIRHVNTRYSDWLRDVDYVQARHRDILWVGLTSRLSEDFAALSRILSLPPGCSLPHDRVTAHRRPDGDPIWLSDTGTRNVEAWYAGDYAFMRHFFYPDGQGGRSSSPISASRPQPTPAQ
jgi:hypothetical protein